MTDGFWLNIAKQQEDKVTNQIKNNEPTTKKKARTKNRKIRNQTLKTKSWSKCSNHACYTNISSVLFTKNRTMTLLLTWNVSFITQLFWSDLLFKTNDDIFHSIVNSFKGKKNLLNTLLYTIPFLKAYQSCIPALIGIVNGDIASLINSLSYSTHNLPHIYLSSLINCAN